MITYDKYGHCVLCHKNMLIDEVIDNRVQKRFTPEYTETEYLLDDNSRMRVAMCTLCKKKLTEKDNEKIMDCVIRGWIVEVESFNHWTPERKKDYIDRYSQRKIVCLSEHVVQDVLDKKYKEYKEKEKKNGTSK